MEPRDILALSARAIAARVGAGALAAEAVAEAFLARAEAEEERIGAWQVLDRDGALAAARALDARHDKGAMAGVPLGIKDVIDTADLPTGYGAEVYRGVRPAWDAPLVAIGRAAGGIVLGKTVSTEFAMASPGKTRNPHDIARTPGGSSSGSCAAVAAGAALVALGTQTSGSILRPASYCGVVGYKPSFGLLDRTGVKPLSGSLDTLGVITRDVRDAGFAAAILADRPALAIGDDVPVPRVGVFRTSRWAQAEPDAQQAVEETARRLSAEGAEVREVPVPAWFDEVFEIQDAVMGWEVTRALAFERLRLWDRLTPVTRDFLAEKAQVTLAQYDGALARLAALRQGFDALFTGLDVLITPAAPGEAPQGLPTGDPVFNRAWTMLHAPAISVPAIRGRNKMPVGVQVVGRVGDDARLLAGACFVQSVFGEAGR